MGFGERLKDIYYYGEEKWYAFWDKLDTHIPVYKVIDPIDNVLPSFALFLIVLFVLLLMLIAGIYGGFPGATSTLRLTVVENDGITGVGNAIVTIEGIDQEFTTDAFGAIDEIQVPFSSTLQVTAQKDDRRVTKPVLVDEFTKYENITLPAALHLLSQKSMRFNLESGEIATGEMTLTYRCSTGSTPPATETIYNGTANVSYTDECGTLSVDVSSPQYESRTFSLTAPSNNFTVTSKTPAQIVRATVNLKLNGVLITEPVSIQAFSSGNSYIPTDTKPASNGTAIFDLPEGTYKFKVRQEQGYKQKESEAVTLSRTEGQKIVNIAMEKNFLGFINVTAKEGIVMLSDVYITIGKKNADGSVTEINNKDTNSSGQTTFELAENGPFVITATKDGYCDKSADANIGATVLLNMVRENATCGNKLKVRVIDQDGKPVAYAKAAIFGALDEDEYKLPYPEKVTDYNGYVEWGTVRNSKNNETFKVFAFKSSYSGWSDSRDFDVKTSTSEFVVRLEVPLGAVRVTVKDNDNNPIQFAEVQLFDEYIPSLSVSTPVSGKKIIQNTDGTIDFQVKADKRVYAVVSKTKDDGSREYESYTSIPKQVIGNGTINFNITLSKPPVSEIKVNFLGLYKNEAQALKVEPNQEYDALFEITAPKNYDELGFFALVGKDNVTKTELDKLYIKEVIAPAKKIIVTGSSYNKPRGYATDEKYLNLEQSKWAEAIWQRNSYTPGKIIVGVKVKIKSTAQSEERLDIGYRAWGAEDGEYERDLPDNELGTNQNSSAKQELYASMKWAYISVGTETLCENPTVEKSFCITSTYTDPDNFTQSFVDSFDAKNNSTYSLSIKVLNNSRIGFDRARTMFTNPEENLYLGNYSLLTPSYSPVSGTINAYETEWIDTPGFVKDSSIDFVSLSVTPQKTGTGTLNLRIREDSSLVFEKAFTINVASDKKMEVKFMKGDTFVSEMPKIVSGKADKFTVKVYNSVSGIEIEEAVVKIYDRFGTVISEKKTNKLGLATVDVPASFPGEKLRLQIEKPEYETYVKEFNIAEDVITVSPESLSFTVNPQTKREDTKTVKVSNQTGMDLTIKEIKLTGKLKGILNEAQIETWFNSFVGKVIKSQDFEEIDFKVVSANIVPTAADLEGQFEITVGSGGKEWTKLVPAKIRVGLGKDVDNPSCLEITQTTWDAVSRGNQIETSFEIKNNCVVDGKPVSLKNLGATVSSSGTTSGTFSAQSKTAKVELGTAFARIFKTTLNQSEKVPVTVLFAPRAGASGVATGSIIFEAQNPTDSKSQKITAEMKYNIIYENLQDCIVIGTDLVTISQPGSGTFTINNTCKFKATFQLDSGDLQGALSAKTFELNAGENKEITIQTGDGQMPGAYNILVYSRQQGTSLELVGNVKVIAEDPTSCFSLTRYEYDVYDSIFNDFDGKDTGYLQNKCAEKQVNAKITGTIKYDNSKLLNMALMGALLGGIGGMITQEKDKSGKWGGTTDNTSLYNNKAAQNMGWGGPGVASNLMGKQSNIYDTPAGDAKNKATESKGTLDNLLKKPTTVVGGAGTGTNGTGTGTNGTGTNGTGTSGTTGTNGTGINGVANAAGTGGAPAATIKADTANAINNLNKDTDAAIEQYKQAILENNKLFQNPYVVVSSTKYIVEITKLYHNKAYSGCALEGIDVKAENETTCFTKYAPELKTQTQANMALRDGCIRNPDTCAPRNVSAENLAKLKGCLKETENVYQTMETVCQEKKNELDERLNKVADGLDKKADEVKTAVEAEINTAQTELQAFRTDLDVKAKAGGIGQPEIEAKYNQKANEYAERINKVYNEKVKSFNDAVKSAQEKLNDSKDFKVANATGLSRLLPTSYGLNHTMKYEKKLTSITVIGASPATVTGAEIKKCALEGNCIVQPVPNTPAQTPPTDPNAANNTSTPPAATQATSNTPTNGYGTLGVGSGFEMNDGSLFTIKSENAGVYTAEGVGYDDRVYIVTGSDVIELRNNYDAQTAQITQSQRDWRTTPRAGDVIENDSGTYTINSINGDTVNYTYQDFPDNSGSTPMPVTSTMTVAKWREDVSGYANSDPILITAGNFILATAGVGATTANADSSTAQGSTMDTLLKGGVGLTAGMMTKSPLWGAVAGGASLFFWEWMTATDTPVDYSDSFVVPMVEVLDVTLESHDGIQMEVGEKTYDFDSYYASSGASSNASTYTGNILYSAESLSAALGLVELRELDFTNAGKEKNRSQYEPFTAVLTASGRERVYDTDYNYSYIKDQAENVRGDNLNKNSGFFSNLFSPTNTNKETVAQMYDEDLTVKEVRDYTKKFHLLFDAWEYVDCGPKTYPCEAREISNCDIDGQKGVTGTEAVPRMKFGWNWGEIDAQECDSENNPNNYNYCDVTQFTISTLKKIMYLREFFKTNSLANCPAATDIAGTKTQALSANSLDVAITSVQTKATPTGAVIETIVSTNNNIQMSAKLSYRITKQDGTIVDVCPAEVKTFTSETTYSCRVDSNDPRVGTGTFNVDINMAPALCPGCENNLTTNDTIQTALVLGSAGAASCQAFKTNRDYFEKVLGANGLLTSESGTTVLEYISFKTNLLRDAFSDDFKNDFDSFINQVGGVAPEYRTDGIQDLFLSDKFSVNWPTKFAAWEPGKYDATIVIEFNDNSWNWGYNNIKSIKVNLLPQGPPEPNYPIYQVSFDGIVGLDTENGRQGYGAQYEQLTEDAMIIANDQSTNVLAQPSRASSNAITKVGVSVLKGTQAFNLLNTSPTKGNVLTIESIDNGNIVNFTITPSVAVPLILNVTRNTSVDSYAFYQAEVNGQPQETGTSFISWTGVGQGCVAFDGTPMTAYYNTPDYKASGIVTGAQGYGLAWMMASVSGTASFYGSFYAPQDTSTVLKMMAQKDSASFESISGVQGNLMPVSTTGDNIKNLKDVIELVKQEKICVLNGDYYWNNTGLREDLKSIIDAKENTCISNR